MRKCEKIVVYRIINISNGKSYIGYTTNFKIRKAKHLNELIKGIHHSFKLQRAVDKHGIGRFEFEIIEPDIPTVGEALLLEMDYIKFFDSIENGYNMTIGGEGIRGHFSEKHWNRIEIYQYDVYGELVNVFPTIRDASKFVFPSLKYERIQFRGKEIFHTKNYEIFTRRKFDKGELCQIHQYDLEGVYLKSFFKVQNAASEISGNIGNLQRAIRNEGTYKGYQWRNIYFDRIEPKKIHSKETTRRTQGKTVCQFDLTDGSIIKQYDVLSDAIREYGWSIAPCVRGKTKTAYGYGWRYEKYTG